MGTGPGGQYLGKIHFIEKPGVQDEGVVMWLNVVLTPGKPTLKSNLRTGPSAIHRENSFYRAQKGEMGTGDLSVFGENSFYRETWGTRRGVVMWLNVVLTPGKPTPKSNLRTGPSAIHGENSLYRAPGGKWAQVTCAGCP